MSDHSDALDWECLCEGGWGDDEYADPMMARLLFGAPVFEREERGEVAADAEPRDDE